LPAAIALNTKRGAAVSKGNITTPISQAKHASGGARILVGKDTIFVPLLI
jgi:hypothetical protein